MKQRSVINRQEFQKPKPPSTTSPPMKGGGERLSLVPVQGSPAAQENVVPLGKPAPLPVCDRDPYHYVPPGRYTAVAVRVQGPEWVRSYRRWSVMIEFELLGERDEVRVCAFFNMGNDPKRPRPGRQSRYFRAWTIANGEQPRKGQEMDPGVFLDGQVFEIEVEGCLKDAHDNVKTAAEVYSKVSWIHRVQQDPIPF